MAPENNELLIKIAADTSKVSEALSKLGEESGALEGTLGKLASISALSWAALVAGIGLSIKAFGEAEASARGLALALQNQGIYSDELKEKYSAYAEEVEKVTGIEKDNIQNAQAVLQGYIGQIPITKELTKAIADLSTKTGDLNSAAEMIGKTVGTGTNAFARQGLVLSETATEQEKLAKVLQLVQTRYGDTAAAANQGVASTKGLQADVKSLLELIGSVFAPAFTIAVRWLREFVQWLIQAGEAVGVFFHIWVDTMGQMATFTTELFSGLAKIIQGALKLDINSIKEGWNQAKNAYATSAKEYEAVVLNADKESGTKQIAEKKALADKMEADRREHQQNIVAIAKAESDLIRLETKDGSKELIDIKKQEIATLKALDKSTKNEEKAQLRAHFKELVALEKDQATQDAGNAATFEKMKGDAKQKARLLNQNVSDKLTKAQQQKLKSELKTEEQARRESYSIMLSDRIKAHNTFLMEQIKYGTAYATINQAMHSNEVQGVKSATGELVELTHSKNSTLKEIGKVAATAQIIIKTAESAMNIYAGFSAIPIIGPILGAIAAAAAVAYGAEQLGAVAGAKDGALVEGGIPGMDSVPFMLEPGELVVPKKNFNDVVGAVGGGNNKDAEMLETLRSIEAKSGKESGPTIVIKGDIHGDKAYVDSMCRHISKALQFRNAKIIGRNGLALGTT